MHRYRKRKWGLKTKFFDCLFEEELFLSGEPRPESPPQQTWRLWLGRLVDVVWAPIVGALGYLLRLITENPDLLARLGLG